MTRHLLSFRDWENCSAYLDGQLSKKQTDHFVLELERRPELRQALEELQRTKLVLKSSAKMRAPRNFTLSLEMVGKSLPAIGKIGLDSLFPILRFSSVLASLMFVFVVLTNLFLGGITRRSVSAPAFPAPEAAVMQAPAPTQIQTTVVVKAESQPMQPPAELMAKEMGTPPDANLIPPGSGEDLGGGMGEAAEAPAMLAQSGVQSTAVFSDAVIEAQQALTPTSVVLPEESLQPYPSPQLRTFAEGEGVEQLQEYLPVERFQERIDWWLVAEIGLAAIALITGLAAILIKRRKV